MIIGICGGSGSGKTTLLNHLSKEFGEFKPTIFSMDNYYKPIELQEKDAKGEYNFDLPTALNKDLLVKDLTQLAEGKSIEVKEYFFNAPPGRNVLITLDPSEIIIVEGIFLFYYEEVRKLLDYSIFIDVDLKTQLDRRLFRDQETRGYTREAILYQWNNHVLPCYENYVQPFEYLANFRFRNNEHAEEDFSKLISELKSLCNKTIKAD